MYLAYYTNEHYNEKAKRKKQKSAWDFPGVWKAKLPELLFI